MSALTEAIDEFRALDEGFFGHIKKAIGKAKRAVGKVKRFIKRDWQKTGRLASARPKRGAGCKPGEKMTFGACKLRRKGAAPAAKPAAPTRAQPKPKPKGKRRGKAAPPPARRPLKTARAPRGKGGFRARKSKAAGVQVGQFRGRFK